jgi:hypothetical protein
VAKLGGAVIVYHPRSGRGNEILDELEWGTLTRGEVLEDGSRRYVLLGHAATMRAFEPMLDRVAPDWREHITAVSPD